MLKVLVRRTTPTAILPVKASPDDAGYDLHADLGFGHEIVLYPNNRKLIPTGLSLAFEPDHYARIAPRSGLANKFGIMTLAGVIDAGYRGEVGVILFNSGNVQKSIKHGDRIAQIIFERKSDADFVETDTLPDSVRGEGGFGSSGV